MARKYLTGFRQQDRRVLFINTNFIMSKSKQSQAPAQNEYLDNDVKSNAGNLTVDNSAMMDAYFDLLKFKNERIDKYLELLIKNQEITAKNQEITAKFLQMINPDIGQYTTNQGDPIDRLLPIIEKRAGIV